MIGSLSPGKGWEFFSSPPCPDRLWAHAASYPGALFLRVKRPGREANHTPLSSAEVTNAWSYTSSLPIHFDGVVLNSSTGTILPYIYHKSMLWSIFLPRISNCAIHFCSIGFFTGDFGFADR
jgi:hypothetical protein